MAVNIHLRTMPHRSLEVGAIEALELVKLCIIDYQTTLGLQARGKINEYHDVLNVDAVEVNSYIAMLANECEDFPIAVDNSSYMRSIVWNFLKKNAVIAGELPKDTVMTHYIENPLLTNGKIDLGDWMIESDGVYCKLGDGAYFPKMWLVCLSIATLTDEFSKVSSSNKEEIKDAMTLLSDLSDALFELNSRSEKDRGDEIKRKLDGLSKLTRNMLEEIELSE